MIGLLSTFIIGGSLICDASRKIKTSSENRNQAKRQDQLYYLDSKGRKRATINGMPVTATTNAYGEDVLVWAHSGETYYNYTQEAVNELNRRLMEEGRSYIYKKCYVPAESCKWMWYPFDKESGMVFVDEHMPYLKKIRRNYYKWSDRYNQYVFDHLEDRKRDDEYISKHGDLYFKHLYHK